MVVAVCIVYDILYCVKVRGHIYVYSIKFDASLIKHHHCGLLVCVVHCISSFSVASIYFQCHPLTMQFALYLYGALCVYIGYMVHYVAANIDLSLNRLT